MNIRQYDKILLKDGRTASVIEICEPGVAYIVDVDLPGPDWETIGIMEDEIASVLEERL